MLRSNWNRHMALGALAASIVFITAVYYETTKLDTVGITPAVSPSNTSGTVTLAARVSRGALIHDIRVFVVIDDVQIEMGPSPLGPDIYEATVIAQDSVQYEFVVSYRVWRWAGTKAFPPKRRTYIVPAEVR